MAYFHRVETRFQPTEHTGGGWDPEELHSNVDLTIHLHRQPEGRWVGLDSTAAFGPTGHGITSSVLHDVVGALGTAQQMLTVRPSAS